MGFADDFTFVTEGVSQDTVQDVVKSTLKDANDWFNCNKLLANLDKTHIMVFSLNRNLSNNELYNCKSVTFLGFQIDSQLSWKDHINYIANKLHTNLYALSKISYHVSFNIAI